MAHIVLYSCHSTCHQSVSIHYSILWCNCMLQKIILKRWQNSATVRVIYSITTTSKKEIVNGDLLKTGKVNWFMATWSIKIYAHLNMTLVFETVKMKNIFPFCEILWIWNKVWTIDRTQNISILSFLHVLFQKSQFVSHMYHWYFFPILILLWLKWCN